MNQSTTKEKFIQSLQEFCPVKEKDWFAPLPGEVRDAVMDEIQKSNTSNPTLNYLHARTALVWLPLGSAIGEQEKLNSRRIELLNELNLIERRIPILTKKIEKMMRNDFQGAAYQNFARACDEFKSHYFPPSQPTSPQPNTGSVRCRDEAAAPHGAAVTPFNHQPKETTS